MPIRTRQSRPGGTEPAARAGGGGAALHVEPDFPLPGAVAVGGGTAVFVGGWCVCRTARIRSLELVVDGEPQPLQAHGMPRLDVLRALHPGLDPYATDGVEQDPSSEDDPFLGAYASGFWGMAAIRRAPAAGVCRIELRARLDGGGEATATLGEIAVEAPPEPLDIPAPAPEAGPLVAVCMATHNPPPDLFRRQVESIRAQTHRNWVCVISDDGSSSQRLALIREVVGDDPRFAISRAPRRLGFYANFERALALAPAAASYLAMADQDDEWYPDKLATLLSAIGNAQLVYSDARIVARDGTVIAGTYWSERRNNHSDLTSLLVANAVTGAASLLRRELLDVALPFPPAQFSHFHDHWVALCALSVGEIAYVDRPLYDYVQHGGASLGHATANQVTRLRERLARIRRDPRERIRLWRLHYFVDACRLLQFAAVLELRCGSRMPRSRRRALRRFLRADRSPLPLAYLAARAAREMVGTPETLGGEQLLLYAFLWRRLVTATARDRPQRRLRIDAVPPPVLVQKPVLRGAAPVAQDIADKVAPLGWEVREEASARVNLLVPTIDLAHFFGGYIGKFNLAKRLCDRGLRVRIVTTDPVGPLPATWRRQVEGYSGLDGLFDRVEVAFARGGLPVEVSPQDRFVATTWWTAHIADAAVRAVGAERFLYLIQEYETFTFPMGTYAALADGSYAFPHTALFSTELLRDFFRRRGLGVYRDGVEAGDARSASFQNAITAFPPPAAADLAGRAPRRLLFYARPEPHAARNMFELGVLALRRAVADGAFTRGWELRGIGTVTGERRLDLGGGIALELLPRIAQGEYGALLREHDVGLALMYTPHPSLVPIEMAAAGMLTVTNTYENKTAEALAAISPNLRATEPSVAAVADGLLRAAADVEDAEARAAGAAVRWSRDWADSFDDALLDRVLELLE